MTVAELMAKLQQAFSLFTPKAVEVWTPIYRAALQQHEGPVLAKAYGIVMQEFDPTPKKAYPSPKDFLLAMPSIHAALKQKTDDGPALDMRGHAERFHRVMAEWREAQGKRAAGGNPRIMTALEHMAAQLANVWSWAEDPAAIRLTRKQVRIVQQQAISQERVHRYGPMPKHAGLWWEQIKAVSADWGIEAHWGDWYSGEASKMHAEPGKLEAAE